MGPVREFIRDLFREWWQKMSFAAFTVFTIYGALTHRDNRWITYGSIVLGLAFIPVAAYHAWRVQNVAKIEAEERLLTNAPIVSLELKISRRTRHLL